MSLTLIGTAEGDRNLYIESPLLCHDLSTVLCNSVHMEYFNYIFIVIKITNICYCHSQSNFCLLSSCYLHLLYTHTHIHAHFRKCYWMLVSLSNIYKTWWVSDHFIRHCHHLINNLITFTHWTNGSKRNINLKSLVTAHFLHFHNCSNRTCLIM